MMKSILILGLGNPLQSDDGIGSVVAQALEDVQAHGHTPLPDDVEVMDGGTPGIGLLNLVEGRRRVIIVDAAAMQQAPGTIVRFTPDQVNLEETKRLFSLHASGIAESLALARALKVSLPEIVVLGVQPGRIDWGQGLSEPVQAAVPRVIEMVLRELTTKNSRNDE